MPSKQWDDESSSEASSSDASPALQPARRGKFADEEDDDDVLEAWDDAEDSEVEREKAKKAEAAKAKAEAEAAANKKSKAERVKEHQARRLAADADDSSDDEEETESERRERMRRTEKEADLAHAESLFGDAGLSLANGRKANTASSAVAIDPSDPSKTVDIASMPAFKPSTKTQFEQMRNIMVPVFTASNKKAHYAMFLQEFYKQCAKDLPSDQIKKIASTLTALGNEKMKEEKAADKGGKKTKAQKTKTQLVAARANTTDTATYEDDGFGDDDFM